MKEVVIAGSGHWLMEEQPAATVAAVRAFLNEQVEVEFGDGRPTS